MSWSGYLKLFSIKRPGPSQKESIILFHFRAATANFWVSFKQPGLDIWKKSLSKDQYYLFSNSRSLEQPGLIIESLEYIPNASFRLLKPNLVLQKPNTLPFIKEMRPTLPIFQSKKAFGIITKNHGTLFFKIFCRNLIIYYIFIRWDMSENLTIVFTNRGTWCILYTSALLKKV